MPTPLAAAWADLLGLLEQRAPRTLAGLRPPSGDVAQAQRRLGTRFTPELIEWFQTVDATPYVGLAELLPFNNVVGLDSAVKLTESTRSIWSDPPDEHLGDMCQAGTWAGTWLPQYVYVGIDGTGGGVFVDLREGTAQGCVRWWDEAEADFGHEPLAAGVTQLVRSVVEALTSGAPVGGWTPVLADGLLGWTIGDT